MFASPAHKLGVVEPSTTSLLLLTVAFRVYPNMKARSNAGLSAPNDLGVDRSWAMELIKHFLSEIPAQLTVPTC